MKKYTAGSIKEYINDLAARKPVPGGGSAAALTAAMGVSLIAMVSEYSLQSTKTITSILKKASSLRRRLIELVDEDISAFNRLKSAYSKRKATKRETALRRKKIQESLKAAAGIPNEVCRLSYEGLKEAGKLIELGNKNLSSDTAMSAILLHSSFYSALYNVRINLEKIEDKSFNRRINRCLKTTSGQVDKLKEDILKGIDKIL
jgi:methenyltetrahydrofolate cyclohydrolase